LPTARLLPPLPFLLLLLLTVLLYGCAVTVPAPTRPARPAPTEISPPAPAPPSTAPRPVKPRPGKVAQPTGPAGSLYLEAEAALRSGNPGRAEILIERALRIDPGNARYWHLLGRAKYDQGAYPQALQFFRKAESRIRGDRELAARNREYLQAAAARAGGQR
ncbi:tetratricopeptide repeat protein, partial [Desulfoprunum benzoelyticum]